MDIFMYNNMEGFLKIKPAIKKLGFEQRGKMSLYLQDGRIIIVPINSFPSIKKLKESDRRSYQIIDEELFTFDKTTEIFHIEQVLGKENNYSYHF